MNPKHVTNLELSKQLFEAGITKDFESGFYWTKEIKGYAKGCETPGCAVYHCPYIYGEDYVIGKRNEEHFSGDSFPALLLSELLELMPKEIQAKDYKGDIVDFDVQVNFGKDSVYLRLKDGIEGYILYSVTCPTLLEALSCLTSYLLREGKFNNTKK